MDKFNKRLPKLSLIDTDRPRFYTLQLYSQMLNTLPTEILEKVIQELPLKSLRSFARVCRYFWSVSCDRLDDLDAAISDFGKLNSQIAYSLKKTGFSLFAPVRQVTLQDECWFNSYYTEDLQTLAKHVEALYKHRIMLQKKVPNLKIPILKLNDTSSRLFSVICDYLRMLGGAKCQFGKIYLCIDSKGDVKESFELIMDALSFVDVKSIHLHGCFPKNEVRSICKALKKLKGKDIKHISCYTLSDAAAPFFELVDEFPELDSIGFYTNGAIPTDLSIWKKLKKLSIPANHVSFICEHDLLFEKLEEIDIHRGEIDFFGKNVFSCLKNLRRPLKRLKLGIYLGEEMIQDLEAFLTSQKGNLEGLDIRLFGSNDLARQFTEVLKSFLVGNSVFTDLAIGSDYVPHIPVTFLSAAENLRTLEFKSRIGEMTNADHQELTAYLAKASSLKTLKFTSTELLDESNFWRNFRLICAALPSSSVRDLVLNIMFSTEYPVSSHHIAMFCQQFRGCLPVSNVRINGMEVRHLSGDLARVKRAPSSYQVYHLIYVKPIEEVLL